LLRLMWPLDLFLSPIQDPDIGPISLPVGENDVGTNLPPPTNDDGPTVVHGVVVPSEQQ
jgi:hypothetical protein